MSVGSFLETRKARRELQCVSAIWPEPIHSRGLRRALALAGISLANRTTDINPFTGYSGTTQVVVQVKDTDNLTDTAAFSVTVTPLPKIYLLHLCLLFPIRAKSGYTTGGSTST
jgi:hypothetical protein